MAFELFVRGKRESSIRAGHCSLNVAGYLLVNQGDMSRARIKDKAAILLDRETKRLGLAPVELRAEFGPAGVEVRQSRGSSSLSINVRTALIALGLDFACCNGRYELTVKADQRLVYFMPAEHPPNGKKRPNVQTSKSPKNGEVQA